MRISRKLPIAAAVLTALSIGAASIAGLIVSSNIVAQKSLQALEATVKGHRSELNTFKKLVQEDISEIVVSDETNSAFASLDFAWQIMGDDRTSVMQSAYIDNNPNPIGEKHLLKIAGDGNYDNYHASYHEYFADYISKNGYSDLLITNTMGDVIYSVSKEVDFAANISADNWQDTGLYKVWKQAVEGDNPESAIYFSDFEAYQPSQEKPTAFISKALFEKGQLLGTVILKLRSSALSNYTGAQPDLGQSAETVVLNSEGLMLTDSMHTETDDTLSYQLTIDDSLYTQAAQSHASSIISNYHGVEYEIALTSIEFLGTNWFIATLVSESEAMAGVTQLRNIIAIIAVILMGIALCSAFIFSRSITRPIHDAIERMRDLINGKTELNLDGAKRSDEIGEIYQAMTVFRDAALEKNQLEIQNERTREQAEKDRLDQEEKKALHEGQVNAAVKKIASGLSSLSSGDLTVSIDEPFTDELDRIRIDFNNVVDKLNVTMDQVGTLTRDLHQNASEINMSTTELSQRTERQAASLEETSAALDEITATVKGTVEKATDASKKANDARSDTDQSSQVVADAVAAMNGIEKASNDINQIINVIDEIAFQTNLLALNAGVEAARAGEAGKGFAVVAQEVRELAGRSAEAAKEIKVLITASENEVSNGVKLVQQAGEALTKISEHVTEIDLKIGDISRGSSEQLEGIQEVNSAVNSMDRVTQQNAAMVEENTAVAHEVSRQVNELNDLIAIFQTKDVEKKKDYEAA